MYHYRTFLSLGALLVTTIFLPACFPFVLSPRNRRHTALNAKISVKRDGKEFKLDFDLVNAPLGNVPLVVLHGGPGLPRDYLLPLKDIVKDRPILFHDQLGCGNSDRPQESSLYSIEDSVNDLIALLNELKFDHFHLYGQSYGGILAFEYLKKVQPSNCLSVTLSSAPSSIPLVKKEWDRLTTDIRKQTPPILVEDTFRRQHVCRTFVVPKALQKAYENASTSWGGIDVIQDYEASISTRFGTPPALVTRGEFDFVTQENLAVWEKCFVNVETKELSGCSHHGLLENPELYGGVLNGFLEKYDI